MLLNLTVVLSSFSSTSHRHSEVLMSVQKKQHAQRQKAERKREIENEMPSKKRKKNHENEKMIEDSFEFLSKL